ncbi:MAG: universal stress protein [Intrasporangium sp.]|uniref:universal stress protein n=1 Tax=Intrasporangium sp. TaxID=1925024 RepID=UPI002647450A|nr:universal stress protein [Intrasporangium sp.]MDN5796325.1 universal stress protein [Intrasporangium sp.]
MSIVVGYPANRRGHAAINLGAMLARSTERPLVVCTVVPAPWMPANARVDSEYRKKLQQMADRALDQARADLPPGVEAEFVVHRARSAASGLLEVANRYEGRFLVIGSSTAGMFGHVTLSSVADRLLHSSPVPVVLATRGFRCTGDDYVTRATVAYNGSQLASQLVAATRLIASPAGAAVRLAAFAVQPAPPDTALLRAEAGGIVDEWVETIRAAAKRDFGEQEDGPRVTDEIEVVVGRGQNWGEALDDIEWDEHEVLVVGSSRFGPASRVFLGSRGSKIVRHSPVPVVVVPRAAIKEVETP